MTKAEIEQIADRVRVKIAADVAAANLRVLKHEAETPMRGHDADGQCCLRAELGLPRIPSEGS